LRQDKQDEAQLGGDVSRNKDQRTQEGRRLLAVKCLWEIVAAAKQQVDPVQWRLLGGIEAEDFLDALDSGRPHPVLRHWEAQKSIHASRPAPGFRELATRHYVVLLCEALQRGPKLGKGMARSRASKALRKAGARVSEDAIRRWQQDDKAPFTPADEKAIANALAEGRNAAQIIHYFVGIIHFYRDPILLG
jgi:hypothetical protein